MKDEDIDFSDEDMQPDPEDDDDDEFGSDDDAIAGATEADVPPDVSNCLARASRSAVRPVALAAAQSDDDDDEKAAMDEAGLGGDGSVRTRYEPLHQQFAETRAASVADDDEAGSGDGDGMDTSELFPAYQGGSDGATVAWPV
jgi:hypothetical protein